MKIAIVGAGAYGTALGHVLELNRHEVLYFFHSSEEPLKKILENSEIAILAVPSKSLPDVLPKIPKNIPLIVATKGILDISIFKNFDDIMAISGPGFADDMKKHIKTKLTTTDKRVKKLFETDWLKFDMTNDIRGVFMCGALKNVYAIDAGRKNLKPGTEAHNKYLKNALEEFKAILYANGADPNTAKLECGKGDLKLTCGYPSRNYDFGQKLITNPDYVPQNTVEGITALSKIKNGIIKIPKTAFILKELIEESNKWS